MPAKMSDAGSGTTVAVKLVSPEMEVKAKSPRVVGNGSSTLKNAASEIGPMDPFKS